jgi:hypothetical protein
MANVYVNVNARVEIDIDEFLDSCDGYEIKQIIKYIKFEYPELLIGGLKNIDEMGNLEIEYQSKFNQLIDHVYKFTEGEEKFLRSIFRKYL